MFKNVTKWKRKNEELQSLEQAEQADLALAGTDFAETNLGVSADEITKTYAKAKDKKRKRLKLNKELKRKGRTAKQYKRNKQNV